MNHLYVREFQVYAGSNLHGAIKEAIELSKFMGEKVRFTFNGVDLEISSDTDITQAILQYQIDLQGSGK